MPKVRAAERRCKQLLRWLRFAKLLVLVVLVTSTAWAQFRAHSTGVVAVYGVEASDSLSEQLESQFNLFGWKALLVSGLAPANEPLIAELYFTYGVNSVEPSMLTLKGPSTVVNPRAGTSGRSVVWATLASERLEPGLHPRVVALRAAELVRAALGVVEPPAPPPPPPAAAPVKPAPPPGFSLGLHGGVHFGKTLGRSYAALPRAQLFVLGEWNAELFGSLPLTSSRVQREQGEAEARVFLIAGGLGRRIRLNVARLALNFSLGGGAAILPTSGRPAGVYVARRDLVHTALAYAQARVAAPVGANVSVSSGLLLGLALPEVSLRFDSKPVGTWGQPVLVWSAGFETP